MDELSLDRFRDPRHTGKNRCPPCTVVNVAIAAAASLLVGSVSVPVGVASFVALAAIIYVKGYLVPGTPTLTKRYLPSWALALFGKEPARTTSVAEQGVRPETRYDVDPESVLLDLDVLEPCDDDLCLTAAFQTAWRERTSEVTEATYVERLGELLGRDPEGLAVERSDDGCFVTEDGVAVVGWPSCAALDAVLAGVPELRDRHPGWEHVPLEAKDRLLNGLLAFLERCPACDGPVSLSERGVNSCCATARMATVACEDCGTSLIEMGV